MAILYIYREPDNGDWFPGVPNDDITDEQWAGFNFNQQRTIKDAESAGQKVWVHRDLATETDAERLAREQAEAEAEAAFIHAHQTVRYYDFDPFKEQVAAMPSKAELDQLNADIATVQAIPPRVDTLETKTGKSPLDYGAVGDYNPDTNTGTDDTAAVQAWINDLRDGEMGVFPPGKLFLCTGEITIKRWTHIEGNGRNSGLFFRLSDPATRSGLILQRKTYTTHADSVFCGKLRNFGVYCRGPLHEQASVGGQSAIIGSYVQRADIRLDFGGHWRYLFHVATTAAYPIVSQGGGIEASTIHLEHDYGTPLAGYSYTPWKAHTGVYNRGWSNAVDYYLNLRFVEGRAAHFVGNYFNANSQLVVRGVLQNISRTELLDTVRIENAYNPTIRDLYQEANGGSFRAINWIEGRIENTRSPVRLTNCEMTVVERSSGITIDADCKLVEVGSGNTAITNLSPSTVFTGIPSKDAAVWTDVQSGIARDPANLQLNGGFDRWIAGSTPPRLWSQNPNTWYVAEKCGVGLTDATRTANTPYCIKLQDRESFSERLAMPIIPANALAGMLGAPIYLSFKYKLVSGRLSIQAADGAGTIGAAYGFTVQTQGVPVENGFTRYVHTFFVSQPMIDSGLVIWFHVPDYNGAESVVYISEVMTGIGVGAPPIYQAPSAILGHSGARMEGGRLIMPGTSAPVSGGDPICGQPWQVGDIIEATAPAPGQPYKWICTTAGTPGTWTAVNL